MMLTERSLFSLCSAALENADRWTDEIVGLGKVLSGQIEELDRAPTYIGSYFLRMNARARVPALVRVVLILAVCTEMGHCANYTVGVGFTNGNTNTSWTNTVNGLLRPAVLEAAYQQWAESVNVTVGDTLVFDYERGQHTVFLAKTLEAYRNCDFSLGSAETMSDADLQTYTIKQTDGTLFFTCTVPGHCEGGQKVKITPFGTTTTTSITPPTSSPSNAPQQPNLIFGMIITLFLMYYLPFFIH